MIIDFSRPWYLLLIPIFIAFVIITSKKLKLAKLRKKVIIFLRIFVFVLLILAISGLNIKWTSSNTSTVFLLDLSHSMKNYTNEAQKFIYDAEKKKGVKDSVGVVTFGDNALIENFLSKDTTFNKAESKPNGTYTNIENAITTALSIMPQNNRKRIVLITDGEENEGRSTKLIPMLEQQKVDFKVYKINRIKGNEVEIDNITVPQKLHLGEEFNLIVNVESTISTKAKLTLFSGTEKQAEENVTISKGKNNFVFKDKASSGGFKSYRVTIEPEIDTQIENNEASCFTNIIDTPKVLLVEDSEGEADELSKMIESFGLKYDRVNSKSVPRSVQGLLSYKSIITCNVSAENLNEDFLKSLEVYIKDFGGGYIATGGDNSFALGGYFKTTLETVLPVDMEIKGKKEIPDMSMMLVIDKSGSMTSGMGGISKLDLAKEAAVRTLDSLRDKDEIGVIAFDDTVYNVVSRVKIQDRNKIRDDIGTIRPGGGTSILPALEEAYSSLKKSNTKIKHIILLTDGQGEGQGFDELVSKIKKDDITVSTVAVGSDSDVELLQRIAKNGGGRFYFTDESTSIPKIFAKETFLASKAYINNREFTPVIESSHVIINDVVSEGLPNLLGYVGVAPKNNARVILKSDEDDPILTVWHYGLGKTIAWNSDINGKWSAKYISWGNNIKLWQNIINWSIEDYKSEGGTLETSIAGNKGNIVFSLSDKSENLESDAVIIGPDMQRQEIKLSSASLGKFTGSFDLKSTGNYMVNIRQYKNGEVVNSVTSGLIMQYSPEYKINNKFSLLENLISEINGKYIKTSDEVFKGNIESAFGKTDMSIFLIILLLIIFTLDIALRRLNLPYEKLLKYIPKFKFSNKKKNNKTYKKGAYERPETIEKIENIENAENIKEPKNLPKDKNSLNTSQLLKNKKNKYK